MGFWSKLGKIVTGAGSLVAAPFTAGTSLAWLPAALGAGGAVMSGLASGQAANRGTSADLATVQQDANVKTSQENRASQESAWKKLLQADYALNSQGYTPSTFTSKVLGTTTTLPTYGIARTGAASDAVRQGATGTQAEALKRLTGGGTANVDLSQYAKPGSMERILGIAAPVATGVGSIYGAMGTKSPQASGNAAVPSSVFSRIQF